MYDLNDNLVFKQNTPSHKEASMNNILKQLIGAGKVMKKHPITSLATLGGGALTAESLYELLKASDPITQRNSMGTIHYKGDGCVGGHKSAAFEDPFAEEATVFDKLAAIKKHYSTCPVYKT